MKKHLQLNEDVIKKEDILTKFEAFEVFRAIKKSNPKIKQEIKKLRKELVSGLSRHDRLSGIWFLNLFKKVVESRSKTISLESLEAAYKTKDKEIIARKLIAYYSNYGIAVGAILGSSGGFLGFLTAAYATFGEIACLSYFQLSLIYDLSVLYERPLDKANNLEVYNLLRKALSISDQDMSNNKVDELVDKGSKLIKEKLYKNDPQVLHGLMKNIGAAVIHKASKNLIAKMIPLFGVVSGTLVCITEDYKSVKGLGKITTNFYNSVEA